MPNHLRRPVDPDPVDAPGTMGFLEHLDELRTRIIRSCIAIGAGMLVAFYFYDRLASFVLKPTLRALPPDTELLIIRPGETLSFYVDIALMGGAVLAAPFVMYQVWRFVAPGLYATEKKYVAPFVLLATIGTLAGASFSHYVMFPSMMSFFASIRLPGLKFTPSLEYTFELYKNLMLGMVIVFQLPTLTFFLARLRLVTARFLWRNIKYAVLIIFIAAAVLTPSPDPWNQTAYAAPLFAMYVISIGVAWLAAPRRGRNPSPRSSSSEHLRLVVAATVIDQAWKHSSRQRADRPTASRRRF